MSRKSKTKKNVMTRRIGAKIIDSWIIGLHRTLRVKGINDHGAKIHFNMDVSNNKRKVKIKITLQEG